MLLQKKKLLLLLLSASDFVLIKIIFENLTKSFFNLVSSTEVDNTLEWSRVGVI